MSSAITDEKTRQLESQIEAIKEAIAERVGHQRFRIWFKNTTKFSLADGCLRIGVPNPFVAGWIENHFSSEIGQAVKAATGRIARISFAIDTELSGQHRRTQLDSRPKPAEGAVAAGDKGTGQGRLKLSLETFVVGRSNELAYNAAMAVVNERHSPFNPLFIHGGYGVGKTHLLQGICNAVGRQRPQANWMYLSAEDFANRFLLALKTKKLDAFRRQMRQTDMLAIDDIHFFANKPSTQEEFLHTFNTIDLAGKQIVMVSDAAPKMIGQLSEKLVNRFISGMVVKIDMPDYSTRCRICRQYAGSMRKQISDSVVKYVAENLRTNVRELQGAILKLIAFSSLQNERINLAAAKKILAEHIARTDPIVHISDIESVVADFFDITPAALHSSKKSRTVSLARHFSMYLARKHTKMSSPEIGRFMGNKNHATVLLACKRIEDKVRNDSELNWDGPAGNRICKARKILAELQKGISG
jgi:chromosomal replication initiator protein